MRTAIILTALVLAATGCRTDELTQLMVSVDTDLSVPEEIDGLTIDITGPQGEVRRADGSLDGEMRLPATLGIVWRGGDLSPINVTVTGTLGDTNVIQYRARAAFEEEQVRLLRVVLARVCIDVRCDPGETCDPSQPVGGGPCRSELVDPSEYEEWTGRPPRIDGSTSDADAGMDGGGDGCVPQGETCNGMDDDCDEAVDEVFDLARDPKNCGTCGNVCDEDPPNGSGVCAESACTVVCDSGWADCGGTDDGCESSLSSATSCGACGTTCAAPDPYCADPDGMGFGCASTCDSPFSDCGLSCVDVTVTPEHCGGCDRPCAAPPRSTAVCVADICDFACDTGFRDCDGMEENGCESQLRDSGNCSACGVTCAPPETISSCASGECEILGCVGPTADCNETVVDGCEVSLADDPTNCGACGNECPADPPSARAACVSARCVSRCDPGFVDCNGDVSDGCEVSLAAAETCGSCGIRCEGATPLCASTGAGGYTCVAACSASAACSGTCADIDTDPLHCGGCDAACPDPAHATRTCAAGACGFECDTNRLDCNENPADGCEASIVSLDHCGGCGMVCNPPDAEGVCVLGICAVANCDPGRANCDASATNGCEVDVTVDAENCGDCGTDCTSLPGVTTVGCTMSACRIDACESGRDDCDDDPTTGCEADIDSDPENCGRCGMSCGTGTCTAGVCG